MAHVFISHVEEDASVALSLALGLEEAGFTTWYYERDSLPGVSYLLQTGTAVENSLAVVLLISRNSLSSNQISREVVRAHESGRPVVPVLIDISHVAFQKRQPEWREAIGAATSIRVGDEGVTGVLPRVVAGLRALGVRAKRVASQSPATEKGTPAAAPVQAMPGRTRRTVTHSASQNQGAYSDDGRWTVNLGLGYAFFVNCSGSTRVTSVHYAQLAQMVAEPAEQLGLDVSIPNQSGYSTEGALALGQHVAAQLRLRSTRLSSLFDFVWRIMLLLFAAEDAHEPPQEERTVMESTLVRAARNAGLLDKQSEELIHTIAWEDLEFWGQATQFLNSVLVTRRIEPAELGS